MAISMGKREQTVVLVVSGVVSILGLHLLIFGPRGGQFSDTHERLKQAKAKFEDLSKLEDPRQIAELNEINAVVAVGYDDALTSIGLSMNEAFIMPTSPDDVVPPVELPNGSSKEEKDKQKADYFKQMRREKYEEQIDLVISEVDRLLRKSPDNPDRDSGDTEMSFLNEDGWDIPLELPNEVQGENIKDQIRDLSDRLELMAQMVPAARMGQRQGFEDSLRKMGIDYNRYRLNPATGAMPLLLVMGEYVPIVHKLKYCDLAWRELGDEPFELSPGQVLTRAKLFEILELNLPLQPMVGADDKQLNIGEMYFLYEQLRFLNRLLELAVENDIEEVMAVQLGNISYLVSQPAQGFGDPALGGEMYQPPPSNKYVLPHFDDPTYVEPPPGEEPAGSYFAEKRDTDIGYCLPISLQYRAKNINSWKFIYAVMSNYPLAELDQITLETPSDGSDSDEQTVLLRFLGVPFIFAMESTLIDPVKAAWKNPPKPDEQPGD